LDAGVVSGATVAWGAVVGASAPCVVVVACWVVVVRCVVEVLVAGRVVVVVVDVVVDVVGRSVVEVVVASVVVVRSVLVVRSVDVVPWSVVGAPPAAGVVVVVGSVGRFEASPCPPPPPPQLTSTSRYAIRAPRSHQVRERTISQLSVIGAPRYVTRRG
jgi:hypothetical protein